MNLIIVVGIVIFLIGCGMYYSSPSGYITNPMQPNPPILGPLSYIAAVAFLLFAVYPFIQFVNNTFNQGLFIIYLGLTIISGLLAKGAFNFGREAAQRKYENMRFLAEAKAAEVEYAHHQIALENAPYNAIQDQRLRDETVETQKREQQVRRTQLAVAEDEAKLRQETIPVAREKGLGVDDVREVNKHFYKTKIELQRHWEETEQGLIAADFADSGQQRQVLAERRAELEQLIRERSRVDREEQDAYIKQKLLARYDKDIANLEAEIDARQARLVLPEVGKENRRLS